MKWPHFSSRHCTNRIKISKNKSGNIWIDRETKQTLLCNYWSWDPRNMFNLTKSKSNSRFWRGKKWTSLRNYIQRKINIRSQNKRGILPPTSIIKLNCNRKWTLVLLCSMECYQPNSSQQKGCWRVGDRWMDWRLVHDGNAFRKVLTTDLLASYKRYIIGATKPT